MMRMRFRLLNSVAAIALATPLALTGLLMTTPAHADPSPSQTSAASEAASRAAQLPPIRGRIDRMRDNAAAAQADSAIPAPSTLGASDDAFGVQQVAAVASPVVRAASALTPPQGLADAYAAAEAVAATAASQQQSDTSDWLESQIADLSPVSADRRHRTDVTQPTDLLMSAQAAPVGLDQQPDQTRLAEAAASEVTPQDMTGTTNTDIKAPTLAQLADSTAGETEAKTAEADNETTVFFAGDVPVKTDVVILSSAPVPARKPTIDGGATSTILAQAGLGSTEPADDGAQYADASSQLGAVDGDLSAIIKTAIDNHPQVKRDKWQVRASAENVYTQRSNYFPVLSSTIDGGFRTSNNPTTRGRATREPGSDGDVSSWFAEGSIGISQLLFDFMATQNQVAAARSALNQSQFVEADSEEQVGLRAVSAYLFVQRIRKNLELSRENVSFHEKILHDIERRAQAGAGDGGDVSQTQSRLALAREVMLNFEQQREVARADFKEAVGSLPTKLPKPVVPAMPMPEKLDEAIEIANQDNPFIIAARRAADSAGYRAEAASAAYLPRFDLDLTYNRSNDSSGLGGRDEDARALVRMNWDLPTGGGKAAEEFRLRNLAVSANHEVAARERQVEQATRSAYANVTMTRERVKQLSDRAQSAKNVVKAYEKQFSAGKRTLLDLLDSENEHFLAQVALNNAEIDLVSAHYSLFSAMGRLRQSFGIPVEPIEQDIKQALRR